MSGDKDARIRDHAYRIWLAEGQPNGCDQDHWYRAARQIEESERGEREVPNGGTRHFPAPRGRAGRHGSTRPEGEVGVLEQPRQQGGARLMDGFGPLKPGVRRQLEDIVARLSRLYTQEEIAVWLNSPHRLLEGRRAIDLIRAGRAGEVVAVIQSLDDGTYT